MILAGDIGGTKTTLAVFSLRSGAPHGWEREPAALETYASRDHATFGELLEAFLAQYTPAVAACCVGVAGPVVGSRCAATNLPWIVDGAELATRLRLDTAAVINDLEAVGFGLEVLRPDEILELQAGASPVPALHGNRAVIAAGTGLGEAGLFWDGSRHRPFGTEGGHADFAPSDEPGIGLLRFLMGEHARVSWERVVSGPGLVNIYRFLRQSGELALDGEPPELAVEMASGDPGAAISKYATTGTSPLCARALELFVQLYGAEAGNLALKMMATGGLYIGGGIAPKNLDAMRSGAFVEAFRAKGRMRPLLEAMPVRLILEPRTALFGAAQCAALRLH